MPLVTSMAPAVTLLLSPVSSVSLAQSYRCDTKARPLICGGGGGTAGREEEDEEDEGEEKEAVPWMARGLTSGRHSRTTHSSRRTRGFTTCRSASNVHRRPPSPL